MTLSDRQIERYSRQIIVPGFGGAAQERLLAARLAILADSNEVEPALSYFAGAGIGHITLVVPGERAAAAERAARIRDLNSDVVLAHAASVPAEIDLLFALVGGPESRAALDADSGRLRSGAMIVIRIDAPARIAVIPAGAGCPRCVGDALLDPPRARAEHAEFVAMVAAIEALKLLAGLAAANAAALIEFDGPAASARPLPVRNLIAAAAVCGCRRTAASASASR
ncbi:hypothetical protein IMX07_10705 [bacterium]|nr:hypothetical protein [bacterium]